jgi:hypothetical protein
MNVSNQNHFTLNLFFNQNQFYITIYPKSNLFTTNSSALQVRISINNEQRDYDEATLIRAQSTTLTCLLNLKELTQPNEENVAFTFT